MNKEEILRQIELLQNQLISLEKPINDLIITVLVSKRNPGLIQLKTNIYREDFIELLRKIPGRLYNATYKINTIPLSVYSSFLISALAGLPRVFVQYEEEAESKLNTLLNGPDLIIGFADGQFLVKVKQGIELEGNITKMFPVSYMPPDVIYLDYKLTLANAAYFLHLLKETKHKITWEDNTEIELNKAVQKQVALAGIAEQDDAPEYDMKLGEFTLKGYQQVGVKFMDLASGNGIIADEPGLGKTIQAVAYAVRSNKRVLIICPAAAKENWRRHLINYTGTSPKVFSGIEPAMYDIINLMQPKEHVQFNLMHYNMFSRPLPIKLPNGDRTTVCPWINYINASKFDVIILDEMHKVKNVEAATTKEIMKIKAGAFMGLSGTPILNRPGEFYPMLYLINPKEFANHTEFINTYTDGRNGVRNLSKLRELLAPIMIRRTKDKVMKDLPPITRTNHYIELTKAQRTGYESILDGVFTAIENAYRVYGDLDGTEVTNILTQLLRLKQYLAGLKVEAVTDLATEFYDQTESKHRKVILFSQFRPVVADIASRLGQEVITFDGTISPLERTKLVDRFQKEPDIHFLACSTTAASEALDMTAAGLVIFTDLLWTPASHAQAEGRAYGRLNDPHSIEALYAMCTETLEDEVIFPLLQEKLTNINALIDGGDVERNMSSSIAMDVIKYLKGVKR